MIECSDCLERLPEEPNRCPICGHVFVHVQPGETENGVRRPRAAVSEGERPGATRETVRPPFVGRQSELLDLREALAGRPTGGAHLIALHGEAGMGKSRLLEEALRGLKASHGQAVWVCEPYGRLLTYGPILEWLRYLGSISPEASTDAVEARLRKIVAGAPGLEAEDVAFLQAALGAPGARVAFRGLPGDHVWRNFHRVVGRLLAARANHAGVCLVVDQAQWLDSATQRFLDAVLGGLAGDAARVVLLTRDRDLGWKPPVAPRLSLRLKPLAARERAELFDALTPAVDFVSELREKVIDQSVGPPSFPLQVPWLEDNGDGFVSNKNDGSRASRFYWGDTWGSGLTAPTIVAVTPDQTIEKASHDYSAVTLTLSAELGIGHEIDQVWANVIPPHAQYDPDTPVAGVEQIELIRESESSSVWKAEYQGFRYNGEHRVIFFARGASYGQEDKPMTSIPKVTRIQVDVPPHTAVGAEWILY